MIVEARLGAYIKGHGIRQSFICEKANIDPDALSRILSGKRDMKLDDFANVCEVLGKTPNDFMLAERTE